MAEQPEYEKVKKRNPEVFESQHSTKTFKLNKKVKLVVSKPKTTNKKLKLAFGGIVVDTKKTLNKVKVKKARLKKARFVEDGKAMAEADGVKNGRKFTLNSKGKKIAHLYDDSGQRFKTNRKPNPPVPPGYIFKPWLGTDTDNESLTHGEESSGNESHFKREKQDLALCSEKGYTLDELLGRYKKRPMNTHLYCRLTKTAQRSRRYSI